MTRFAQTKVRIDTAASVPVSFCFQGSCVRNAAIFSGYQTQVSKLSNCGQKDTQSQAQSNSNRVNTVSSEHF